MPKIIPIKELKNTSEISDLCHKTNEPIFITIITSNFINIFLMSRLIVVSVIP